MTAAEPVQLSLTGRNANGSFAPGHKFGKLGGRPRGLDIRAVCERHARENGIDLELAIWEIMQMQISLAKCGDAAAVKTVLSVLGDSVNTDEVSESLAEVIAATIEKNRTRLAAS